MNFLSKMRKSLFVVGVIIASIAYVQLGAQESFVIPVEDQVTPTDQIIHHFPGGYTIGGRVTYTRCESVSNTRPLRILESRILESRSCFLNDAGNVVICATFRNAEGMLISQHIEHEECSICDRNFEMGEPAMLFLCNHIFHKNCFQQWYARAEMCLECRNNDGICTSIKDVEDIVIQKLSSGASFKGHSLKRPRSVFPD